MRGGHSWRDHIVGDGVARQNVERLTFSQCFDEIVVRLAGLFRCCCHFPPVPLKVLFVTGDANLGLAIKIVNVQGVFVRSKWVRHEFSALALNALRMILLNLVDAIRIFEF